MYYTLEVIAVKIGVIQASSQTDKNGFYMGQQNNMPKSMR